MFVVTNLDYAEDSVSDVYGPFKTEAEAEAKMRGLALSEFEEVKGEHDDAEIFDDVPGEVEIVFGENDGCLYQVLEVKQ